MKKQAKRILSLLLALMPLPLWNAVPAQAAMDSVMGVNMGGLISYGIDRGRVYQGGKYDAAIKIGENLSFTGTLSEGLSDEMLQKCIDDALAAEHLTKKDVIETNKMVAELLSKMKSPRDFWAELDFYSEMLGYKQYTDTVKHMVGSATKPGEGVYKGLTAQEKQFVQEQLGKTMDESFDAWKADLTDVGGKIKDKITPNPVAMAEEALSTNVIGKGYKVLSGVWKAMRRNIEQEKSLDALKESVMKRQLLVEAFYKRAGTLVKDYLKDHGQWQLRVDGSRQKNAKVEQMTKLNFDYANLDGSFSTFYTIQPIKLTWSADAFFIKDDHSENPNGTYTGRMQITGEYDVSTLQSHITSIVDKFEQYSLTWNDAVFLNAKITVNQKSQPSVKQTWRVDQCQIEILGLSENGAATIQLPNLVAEKHITMDYMLSASHSYTAPYVGTSTATSYDQVCTPEHAEKSIQALPETWRGEVMDFVCLIPLEMVTVNRFGTTVESAENLAAVDDLDTAFVIRAPFEGWTGYKRIEITKSK